MVRINNIQAFVQIIGSGRFCGKSDAFFRQNPHSHVTITDKPTDYPDDDLLTLLVLKRDNAG